MGHVLKTFYVRHPRLQPVMQSLRGAMNNAIEVAYGPALAYAGNDFLLIVGSGRSGNTLIRRLVVEQGDIYIPPESYVFGSVASTFLGARGIPWPQKVDLTLGSLEYYPEFQDTFGIASLSTFASQAKEWPRNQRTVGTLLVEAYRWIAASEGTRTTWIGDKTPLNTLNLGLMRRLFPAARYAFIQRDPFDVIASYVAAGLYGTYSEAAERWILSWQAWSSFRSQLPGERFVEVRYEELVRDHARVVSALLRDLGIPGQPKHGAHGAHLGDVDVRAHHASVLGPVTTDSVGRGRRSLPRSVRAELGKRVNGMAIAAGYEPI